MRDLKQAEEADQQRRHTRGAPLALSADLQAAFTAIGQQLPALWTPSTLARTQKKAVRRGLLDTVIIQRVVRAHGQTRIVWKGGDTTPCAIPITGGALAELSSAQEMEHRGLPLPAEGKSDQESAEILPAAGFRSPQRPSVLRSTVQILRLKHRAFITHTQSHPRRIAGFLTVSQLARGLDLSVHWLYDRINNGRRQIQKDPLTGLYLFPDHPTTLARLKQLREGHLQHVGFGEEYQDA